MKQNPNLIVTANYLYTLLKKIPSAPIPTYFLLRARKAAVLNN